MMFLGGVLIAIFGLACQATPLSKRQTDGSTFGLYAYGDNINGLPVFYADGLAQIGDASHSTATTAKNVYFTYNPTNSNTWIAHVNNTLPDITTRAFNANAPKFGSVADSPSTLLLSLTQTNSTSTTNPVGFITPGNSGGKIVDTFAEYSFNVLLKESNARFYGRPTGNGTYALLWSTVTDNQNIPLLLKTIGVWKQPVSLVLGM
ncbi:hypothetical protein N7486_009845 [Penicillium sp. IBT 16267x]|nr:hypothetical protein N7486_009845 [Penicillium sp. IBT 16267x]